MTIQITVLGLSQVGVSIGLALAEHKEKIVRVGNDRDPGVMGKAKKMGAFDTTTFNLPGAVEKADVVILALPVDERDYAAMAEDLLPYRHLALDAVMAAHVLFPRIDDRPAGFSPVWIGKLRQEFRRQAHILAVHVGESSDASEVQGITHGRSITTECKSEN